MEPHKLIIRAGDIAAMAGERRVHFLNPNADRVRKSLGDLVGLAHIGVHLVEVEPGRDSTEYHRHFHEEECLYILSGEGTLTIEGQDYPVRAGDFAGFPADTAAHALANTGTETLVFLVMGQRLAQDVADYPNRRKRLYRNDGKWDLVDFDDISDPREPG